MPFAPRFVGILGALTGLALLGACSPDNPTTPQQSPALSAAVSATGMPSGERLFGKVAIEPAYNADNGDPIFLLTPIMAPLPAKSNPHAYSPLYLVEYPPGSTVGTMNCEGVPGNCPDHDLLVAQVATGAMPGVYGMDPYAVPGHDHLADAPGPHAEFNIAWEVIEVVFTNAAAANTRLTTDADVKAAVARGDAIEIDLGFAFNCNVVPARLYWKGTPIGG